MDGKNLPPWRQTAMSSFFQEVVENHAETNTVLNHLYAKYVTPPPGEFLYYLLLDAIKEQQIDLVRRIVSHKDYDLPDLMSEKTDILSPVWEAICGGNEQMLDIILEHQPVLTEAHRIPLDGDCDDEGEYDEDDEDSDCGDNSLRTPLEAVVRTENFDVLIKLLDVQEELDSDEGNDCLGVAVRYCSFDFISKVLSIEKVVKGINSFSTYRGDFPNDIRQGSPLKIAAQFNRDVIIILLEAGADPNINYGLCSPLKELCSSLHISSSQIRRIDLVTALIEKTAMYIEEPNNESPLLKLCGMNITEHLDCESQRKSPYNADGSLGEYGDIMKLIYAHSSNDVRKFSFYEIVRSTARCILFIHYNTEAVYSKVMLNKMKLFFECGSKYGIDYAYQLGCRRHIVDMIMKFHTFSDCQSDFNSQEFMECYEIRLKQILEIFSLFMPYDDGRTPEEDIWTNYTVLLLLLSAKCRHLYFKFFLADLENCSTHLRLQRIQNLQHKIQCSIQEDCFSGDKVDLDEVMSHSLSLRYLVKRRILLSIGGRKNINAVQGFLIPEQLKTYLVEY